MQSNYEEIVSLLESRLEKKQLLTNENTRCLFAGGFLTGVVFSHTGIMGFLTGLLTGVVVSGGHNGILESVFAFGNKLRISDMVKYFEYNK
jgi:hypothetical protein